MPKIQPLWMIPKPEQTEQEVSWGLVDLSLPMESPEVARALMEGSEAYQKAFDAAFRLSAAHSASCDGFADLVKSMYEEVNRQMMLHFEICPKHRDLLDSNKQYLPCGVGALGGTGGL